MCYCHQDSSASSWQNRTYPRQSAHTPALYHHHALRTHTELKEPKGLGVLNIVTNHPFLTLPQIKMPSMVVPSPDSQTWRESHSSPWRTVSGTLRGTAHREAQGQALPSEPHKSAFTQLSPFSIQQSLLPHPSTATSFTYFCFSEANYYLGSG